MYFQSVLWYKQTFLKGGVQEKIVKKSHREIFRMLNFNVNKLNNFSLY